MSFSNIKKNLRPGIEIPLDSPNSGQFMFPSHFYNNMSLSNVKKKLSTGIGILLDSPKTVFRCLGRFEIGHFFLGELVPTVHNN